MPCQHHTRCTHVVQPCRLHAAVPVHTNRVAFFRSSHCYGPWLAQFRAHIVILLRLL